MKSYFNMLKHAFDFKGRVGVGEYIIAIIVNMLVNYFLLLIINVYVLIYACISVIPLLSLTIRRLHDTGKTFRSLFLLLIPVFGWFVLIITLLTKSKEDQLRDFDRYHW